MSVLQHVLSYGTPAFALGVYVGWFSEARKGHVMSLSTKARTWFDRWMAVLYLGVAALALVGIVIATTATLTNARQDQQAREENAARDKVTASLLHCFDDFATDLTEALPPVRVASANRDNATANRDAALQRLLTVLAQGVADQAAGVVVDRSAEFAEALTRLVKTGQRLDRAQAELETARGENPYPESPSITCATTDEEETP